MKYKRRHFVYSESQTVFKKVKSLDMKFIKECCCSYWLVNIVMVENPMVPREFVCIAQI